MSETRVILSPLFSEKADGESETFFTNKIGEELLRSCTISSVRLLSLYTPLSLPATRLYIKGIRRNVFGEGPQDGFFHIGPMVAGETREDFHSHVASLNIHSLVDWSVKITSASDVRETLTPPEGMVVELGISQNTSRMKSVEYLPFVLAKDDLNVRLKTFERLGAQAKIGLVDIFIPSLANVYQPFNFITATTSRQQHAISNTLDQRQEITFTLPVDYYSDKDMRDNACKFLRTLGCRVEERDGRLFCNRGEVGQRIILHEKMVSFWDVRGSGMRREENSISFLADGLSFGRFQEQTPIPNPLIFECDLLQHSMLGSKPFRLLRMLFPHTGDKGYGRGSSYLFDNIQMVEAFESNICTIGFRLLNCEGGDVSFAKGHTPVSGTLVIRNE